MVQKTSPFVEGKYGWNFGESGWNSGMDENILKFSFLFDGNVNDIVSTLPPASNGTAFFNTADNRLYFAVGNLWYSSVCPKHFIFKIKATGDFYQFDGSSAVKIDSPSDIKLKLDSVELILSSLGSAAWSNTEDFVTPAQMDITQAEAANYTDALRQELAEDTNPSLGAELVGGALITVSTIADMLAMNAFGLQSGRQVSVKEYRAGTGFGGGIYYWSPSTPAASHNGGTVISAAADFPSDWTLEAQQTAWFTPGTSGVGCWVAVHEDSIEASRFGADYSGTTPSDLSLLAALQYSAATATEVTTSGKIRLTKTLNQPRDSIITCNGVVFCEDPAGLTDGWLWRVLGENSVTTRTEIRRLVLSTYPDTRISAASKPGRLMKGLQVSTAHVRIGDVDTYGFQLAGVEFGPTGFEIIAGNVTCNASKWANPDAVGFRISTSDSAADNVIVVLYPIGAQLGAANHVGNLHVWGMPATAGGVPEQVMFTGVIFGRESSVDYLYVDTHDTASYDTEPSGDRGVGVVFRDERNHIGSLNFLIHGSTKPNKLKLIRYGAAYNMIDHLAVGLGSPSYNKTAPIIYDNPSFIWLNRIDKTSEQSHVNAFTYTSGMPIAGVSAYTGNLRLEKVGGTLSITLYNQITGYSAASSSPVDLTLPSGLTMRQGVLGVTSVSSCFNVPQAAVMPMTVSPNIVRFYYKNTDTGLKSPVLQSTLRPGELEFSLSVPLVSP